MANILIVDGHRHVAELLTEELVSEGYSVDTIADPDSIRDRITLFGPDLVLLDLYLNRKTRWDVLRDIRLCYPRLPVVIFTGYDGYLRDPRISQADGFVVKSIFFDTVKRHVDTILNKAAVFQSESVEVNIAPMWMEQRTGEDRRQMERRKRERRSLVNSREFLLGRKADRRSGSDRRHGDRRKGERRRVERRLALSMIN